MTNFAKFKAATLDELADFLDRFGQFDGSPWMDWFNETYCKKCDSIKCKIESTNIGITPLYPDREIDCAYCELEKKCKFFEDLEEVPNIKTIIKMWLESPVKEGLINERI